MIGVGAILALVAAYWQVIVGLVLILLTIIAIVRWWDRVRFLKTRAWYAMPGIGKTARLSKNHALGERGWFLSENELCSAFHSHLEKIVPDPIMYDRAQSYLTKVHEIGRSPVGFGGWTLIFILIFIESLGFAYVLAGYTLPGASEALQIPGALLIAVLISIALVILTHISGYEWYKRGLVRMARVMWVNDEDEDRPKNLIIDRVATLAKDDEDDDTDDKEKAGNKQKTYHQLLRRLKTQSSIPGIPWINIVTLLFIGGVAYGAYHIRVETYERDQTCDTLGGSKTPDPNIFSGVPGLGVPQPALPTVITDPQRKAEKVGVNEQCSADRSANVTTYLVLALVFVVVQLIGWIMGFSKSFAGRQSKNAWRKLAGFDNKTEYENWHERERDRIINISQRHLSSLQSRLSHEIQTRGVSGRGREAIKDAGTRTFEEYLDHTAKRKRRNKSPQNNEN